MDLLISSMKTAMLAVLLGQASGAGAMAQLRLKLEVVKEGLRGRFKLGRA